MARVLVLGGTSYVAQFVLRRLLQDATLQVAGDNVGSQAVTAVACTIRRDPFPLPKEFVGTESDPDPATRAVCVYWGVDVLDLEAMQRCIDQFRPTIVVNCTALSNAAVCQKNPERARCVNEPRGLIDLLGKIPWQIRFVHFSTDFVYDGLQQLGESYKEEDAKLSPLLSEYGASKLRFDQFLVDEQHTANLEILVLRIANVVGPSAPLLPQLSASKFVEWLHSQLFNATQQEETPLKLWRDEFRSYLYVEDLVAVVLKLLEIDFSPSIDMFNVGGKEALSRVELAQRYLSACEKHDPDAVAAITRAIVPITRANVDLGYPSPLNTRLNTTRLSNKLPSFTWTPTDQFLDEISARFLSRSD